MDAQQKNNCNPTDYYDIKLVFFIAMLVGTYYGIKAICYHEQCEKNMSNGDIPPTNFKVMVRLTPNNNVVPIQLSKVNEFLEQNSEASLYLINSKGTTEYQDWDYTVLSQDNEYQVIEARYFDDANLYFKYKASGITIKPLTSKETNSGFLFSAMLFGATTSYFIKFIAGQFLMRLEYAPSNVK